MKPTSKLRLVILVVSFLIGLLFFENKRKENRRTYDKMLKRNSSEANEIKISNTDYIFFEGLNKYLSLSLQ